MLKQMFLFTSCARVPIWSAIIYFNVSDCPNFHWVSTYLTKASNGIAIATTQRKLFLMTKVLYLMEFSTYIMLPTFTWVKSCALQSWIWAHFWQVHPVIHWWPLTKSTAWRIQQDAIKLFWWVWRWSWHLYTKIVIESQKQNWQIYCGINQELDI